MTAYQVMPPLTWDEYTELSQSIKANGVLVPVIIDDDGQIIDGHHRAEIAHRLGLAYPQVTKDGTPAELRTLAFSLNLHRRHLSREQKRELVETSLKADPEMSDREHGRRTGMSHPTVADVRTHLETAGDVEKLSTRTDSLGRQQPATKQQVPDGLTRITETTKADTYVDTKTGEIVPAPEPAPKVRHKQPPVLAGDALAKYDAEKACEHLGSALGVLESLAIPEARARMHTAWLTGSLGSTPHNRELHTPATIRRLADALATYADEMERNP